MSAANADSSERFPLVCNHCERQISVRTEWIGREVQCPHCSALLLVPQPKPNGLTRAEPPRRIVRHGFNFACPRCESLLETHAGMCGQKGTCPTCGANFLVPNLNPSWGRPGKATLLDEASENPVPLHPYAASGQTAPRIIRDAGGQMAIQCPRCNLVTDVDADCCSNCGTPFTADALPTESTARGDRFGSTALIVGLISIPFTLLIVPGAIAVLLGLLSWFRGATLKPTGLALAGIILGVVSAVGGLIALVM